MGDNSLKKILTAGIMIVLFIIAVRILLKLVSWVVAILLPVAVLALAGYVVYRIFQKR